VVRLNKAHAAHVCRQVEDMIAPSHHLLAVVKHPQVHKVELVTEDLLLQDTTSTFAEVQV
jgi:hypothetical protein